MGHVNGTVSLILAGCPGIHLEFDPGSCGGHGCLRRSTGGVLTVTPTTRPGRTTVPKVSSRYERARTREVANWVVEERNALQQLADDLTDRGFIMPATVRLPQRPVPVQQVHKVLRSRYYLGSVTFAGANSTVDTKP
jgi:hypothetical protein